MDKHDTSLDSLRELWLQSEPFDASRLVRALERAAYREGLNQAFCWLAVPFMLVYGSFLIRRQWLAHHNYFWALSAGLAIGTGVAGCVFTLWGVRQQRSARKQSAKSPEELLRSLLDSERVRLRFESSPLTWLALAAASIGFCGMNAVAMHGGYSPMGIWWFVMVLAVSAAYAVAVRIMLGKTRREVQALEDMLRSLADETA